MSKVWNEYGLSCGASIFRGFYPGVRNGESGPVGALRRGLRGGFQGLGRKCWKCGGKGVKTRLITKGKHSCVELGKGGVTRQNVVQYASRFYAENVLHHVRAYRRGEMRRPKRLRMERSPGSGIGITPGRTHVISLSARDGIRSGAM